MRPPYTPETERVTARWRVNTASSASEISPTVARARSPRSARARRLPLPLRAASVSAPSAAATFPSRRGADPVEARDLRRRHLGVVDGEDLAPSALVLGAVLVDADDGVLAAVDPRLAPRRRLLDAQFRHAALDRLGHAAQRLDLVDQRPAAAATECVRLST